MDNLNEIFSTATQGDLDTELAAAGEMLQKIAEEQGIDLSELDDKDIAELMVDLMPKVAEEHDKDEPKPEAKAEAKDEKKDDEKKAAALPAEVTFADVAVELSKRAAAEEIDLSKLSRDEYHEAYNLVAQSMTSPEYAIEKQAEAEAAAKLAEADALGRHMARSFMDEQAKIAGAKVADAKTVQEMPRSKTPTKALFGRPETAKDKVESVGRKLREKAVGAAKAGDEAIQRGGAKLISKLPDAVKSRLGGISAGGARAAGLGAGALGAAGLGAAAYGAKKLMDGDDKKKRSADVEAEAIELARSFLAENGIDPDTGAKVASNEAIERANELLREHGYID